MKDLEYKHETFIYFLIKYLNFLRVVKKCTYILIQKYSRTRT